MHLNKTLLALIAGGMMASNASANDDTAVDPMAALDCGVSTAFIAGFIEADAPEESEALASIAKVWLELSYLDYPDGDEAFEATVERLADEFETKLSSAPDSQVEPIMLAELDKCDALMERHAGEFEAMEMVLSLSDE